MQTAKKKITANTKPDGPIKTFFSRKRIIKKKRTVLHFASLQSVGEVFRIKKKIVCTKNKLSLYSFLFPPKLKNKEGNK